MHMEGMYKQTSHAYRMYFKLCMSPDEYLPCLNLRNNYPTPGRNC